MGLASLPSRNITIGTNMGMSHIKIDQLIRTPHANEPNCAKVELLMKNDSFDYKKMEPPKILRKGKIQHATPFIMYDRTLNILNYSGQEVIKY